MSMTNLGARVAKLKAKADGPADRHHVITNISDGHRFGGFRATHGRFKTVAEMDAEEAALRASGKAKPGEEVVRIQYQIIDAQRRVVEQSE